MTLTILILLMMNPHSHMSGTGDLSVQEALKLQAWSSQASASKLFCRAPGHSSITGHYRSLVLILPVNSPSKKALNLQAWNSSDASESN